MTATPIDDATAEYILESQPHFEDLRQAASQLAGLLVLAAAGASTAAGDHPLLGAAERRFEESVDGIRRARVTVRARSHHRHLAQAAAAISTALSVARRRLGRSNDGGDLDAVLVPLRAGYVHLQQAADALPGFQMVAFDQGCCGEGRQ